MVYWSLSIEIQFYLIMAVCLLLGRRGIEAWLICVSACSLILNQAHWIDLSGLIPTYWLQFACGIAAFYWITGVHRIKATPWILLLIPLVATCLSWKAHYTIAGINANYLPSIKLLFCAAAAICMKLTYASDKRIIQLPASRCLAALGTISYSLYLTHVPFGSRIFNLGERLIGSSALQWCLCMPVAFLLSILFGYSFYLLCERSFINPR